MNVEIPKDIKGLIAGSHPATLSTQIPAGPHFDGARDEVIIHGCADIRWARATPSKASLRFHFRANDTTDADLIKRFNGYFKRCGELVDDQGPGIPAGHVVLTVDEYQKERGAGPCTGLPQFKKSDGKWVVEDNLNYLSYRASDINLNEHVKLIAVSWDPNLDTLMKLLGGHTELDKFGTLEIGNTPIAEFAKTPSFPVPTCTGSASACTPPACAAPDKTVAVDALYRVEFDIPKPPPGVDTWNLPSTLFAALSFASGLQMDFIGTAIVQNGVAIYLELKPQEGGSPDPFCPPINWPKSSAHGAAPSPLVASDKTTFAKVASLFFHRIIEDLSEVPAEIRFIYTHPLLSTASELADAMQAGPAQDLYLAVKRVHALVPVAIEMIAKHYEMDTSGKAVWNPLPRGNNAKNDRIKKLIGDNAHKFWAKIRNPLAHELRLMENGPLDIVPSGHPSGNPTQAFLSKQGQEYNARFRDLWKVQRCLLTMLNHVVLRVIGYTGNATNWADENKQAYDVGAGNAPAPQQGDFETEFAKDNWG